MNNKEIIENAEQWLKSPFDLETQKEVKTMLEGNYEQLIDGFCADLEFGTGGMRGIMGSGTNRINKYTLGKAAQGLSNYLLKRNNSKQSSIVIAFDCRHQSDKLAKIVADVFTANGIKVFLFKDMRPTPQLSFVVSYLGCDAGIVLTASHNPPEYNGFKVYGSDGAQIVSPEDTQIISAINDVDFSSINFKAKSEFLQYLGKELDHVFTDVLVKHMCSELPNKKDLKIVFTPLHGTAIKVMPLAFEKAGYTNIYIVEEQRLPDGDFPTVDSPNPEESKALKLAIELAYKVKADILIGTDPDSDRLGIAVRDLDGKMKLLNGNQAMVVMTDFLLKKWGKEKKLNGKQFVASTVVSTDMMSTIANSYGVDCKICLTGFKWIAKLIKDHGTLEFIGGGEESFGYMAGSFVRDKDAISATLLACEIAAQAKLHGSTFYKELLKLYQKHGFYKEGLLAIVKNGQKGRKLIKKIMSRLRRKPLRIIGEERVKYVYDYQSSVRRNLRTNDVVKLDIPKSNVLVFVAEKGTKIAVRPSGTEPKIKFYFGVKGVLRDIKEASKVERELDDKIYLMSQKNKGHAKFNGVKWILE